MDEDRRAALTELEERLGYRFKEMKWLDQAFTHKSFVYENSHPGKLDNEVLEFLGDSVLGLAVSTLLLKNFPEAREGTLSLMRSQLVKRSFLAALAKELHLGQFLHLGKSQRSDSKLVKTSILANTYEALIGALFRDAGFDQALEMIQSHFEPYLQMEMPAIYLNDFKSLLQIQSQQSLGASPQYHVVGESGPDHNKWFQVSVSIHDEVKGVGQGKSKKEAEQDAAREALAALQISERTLQQDTPPVTQQKPKN